MEWEGSCSPSINSWPLQRLQQTNAANEVVRWSLFTEKELLSFPFPPLLYRGPTKSKCTGSFFKVVVFQKCLLIHLLALQLVGNGVKSRRWKTKKQPESDLNIHQDEWGASDGKTDDILCLLSPPSSFWANQFPPNDKNTCYFCLPD